MTRVLIHRYDNEADILDVERRHYSGVYRRAPSDAFQLVAVVPTGRAKTTVAVVADAAGPQSSPDEYMVRVPVTNVWQRPPLSTSAGRSSPLA